MRFVFPTLYLLTDSNQVRFWDIWVIKNSQSASTSIYTKSGLQSGKIIQPYPKIITRSIGKKDTYARALQLATTMWNNHLKKGFKVIVPKQSQKSSVSTVASNNKAIIPMKAYSLTNHIVIYPAYVQPKIDGYRALLHKEGQRYEFISNTGKYYQHLEHLKKELNKIKMLSQKSIYLDGELYIEDGHVNILRSILSTIELTSEKRKIAEQIKFYVFDMFDLKKMDLTYEKRYKILQKIFKTKFKYLVLVPTTVIKNEKQLNDSFKKYVGEGYEGIIIRNMRGLYKLRGKSVDVLKSKDVKKDIFTIVGYKESKGNNRGTVIWEIRCNKDSRKSFWAKPMGSREDRKKMFKNADKYIGKKVMVKYFEIDKNGCITKNPIAMAIW